MVLTEQRASALRAIDPYWNPEWAVSWQRRYAALTYLLHGEDGVPDVPAGVRVNGVDVGTWLARQTTPAGWTQLAHGQRALLQQLGIQAPEPDTVREDDTAAAAGTPGLEALDSFDRGLLACRQYRAREGHLAVPRKHQELLYPVGDGAPVAVRPGVFLSNARSRRSKLTVERLRQLADLGLHWAQAPTTTERQR